MTDVDPRAAPSRIGVIGLGRMGLPMARHLIAAGFDVAGFDVDPERRAALVGLGGRQASSPRDLAERCDAILVMVADDAQVKQVTLGPEGALRGARAGAVIIISSTVTPATCREVAGAARAKGVGLLDAPVCRGQRGAEAGTLTVLVGGDERLAERCRPIFQAFGEQVFHLGEEVGAGQVGKMINNLLLWTGVVGVHTYLTLGRRLGVAPSQLRAALLHSSADSWALRELNRINLTWPDKDLAQALEVAESAGIELPLVDHVRGLISTLTRDDLQRLCRDDGEGRE